VAYLSNYLVAKCLGADHPATWRWMFGVMALPAVAFLCTAMFIPESPRWLIRQGRRSESEVVLGRFGHPRPKDEAEEIQESLKGETAAVHQKLFQRKYLKPLLLACIIGIFNQLDGINAVLYYAPQIFRMAGAGKADALRQSVIIGLTNLVMTIVAMGLIDRIGRKTLLLMGSVTFVISHLVAAWVFRTNAQGWVVMVALMGIVGSHAYSQGAVVWVLINELLPNAVRASGSALVCFVIWVCCGAVSWSFPVVVEKGGGRAAYAFEFFAAMMVLQFFVLLKFLPETKGISLEELQKRLGVVD
jgi:sugar porter (SP) family MFS transporter